MSTALAPRTSPLGGPLLRHFATQLDSARRLLALVLEQGQAIRVRDVDQVLGKLAAIQGEMERRGTLERERTALLTHAASGLGIPAHAVTLEHITTLLSPDEADAARNASAELRGLLDEIAKQHTLNRALMKQELSFLDHLTRMLGAGSDHGAYGRPTPAGVPASPALAPRSPALRALDLQA